MKRSIKRMLRLTKKHFKGILIVLFLSVTTGLLVYSLLYVEKLNRYFIEGEAGSEIVIAPSSGKLSVGGQYSAFIILNTDQSDVNAVDLKLKFDPSAIRVIQVVPNQEAFKSYLVNTIDNNKGETSLIALSYDQEDNRPTVSFRGKQNIAEVKFETLKSTDSTTLSVVFEKGSTIDSNTADARTNKDILAKVQNATYEVTAAKLTVTAYATSSNSIPPKLTLSISQDDVEKEYQTIDIATAPVNENQYKDHIFEMSQGIKNGDIIYLDFENDTRDGEDNRPGSQDRNIYIQKITFGDRVFYLAPENPTQESLAKKDKDDKRVYYDRSDREGGFLYDNGRFGKFGTSRDAAESLEIGIRENGLMMYDDPLGWGPSFRGHVFWNGALVIKVDFLADTTPPVPGPIPTPTVPTPVPPATEPPAPTPVNRASNITSPSNPTLISTSATFIWDSGENISSYELRIGTTGVGSNNITSQTFGGSSGQATVNSLPDNGADLYVRLVSNFQDGSLESKDYRYKAYTKPAPTPTQPQNELVIRARGTPAFNFGPTMKVYVNSNLIATEANVTSLTYRDFVYRPTTNVAIDKVDIEFPNDAWQNAQNDRNLYIDYIRINGITFQAEDKTKVKYDRGSGFDNIDVIDAREDMLWSGALRFSLSGGVAPPPPVVQKTKITVRARGQKAFNVGPNMKIYVNTTLFNTINQVTNTSYSDFTVDVLDKKDNISSVYVVFDNDAWESATSDRNLYVDYIKVDDSVYQSEDTSKVVYDRGLPFDNQDILAAREDMLWNGALKYNLKAATPSSQSACAPTGENYITLSITSKNDRPAALHADMNLALRSYVQIINDTNLKRLIDLSGGTDTLAPQFSTIFDVGKPISITSVYNIYDWSWEVPPATGTKGNRITFPEVTMMGLATTKDELVRAPDSGYSVSAQDHEAYVLYASEDRLTLNYTRDDTVSSGYTVHFEKLCVDSNLLSLYRSLNINNPIKRASLPVVSGKQPVGRALGDEVLVVIRDKGSFMDPRSRKDWWR